MIFPSNRGGGWNIRTVPTEIGGLVPRVPLPETWIDKNSKKPEGMTFCHPNRFLAAFENLKQAIDAAIETLNQ